MKKLANVTKGSFFNNPYMNLHSDLERFLDLERFFSRPDPFYYVSNRVPRFSHELKSETYREDDNFVIKVDLPGVNKADLTVELWKREGILHVSATRASEEKTMNYSEIVYGTISRNFDVSSLNVLEDKISSELKNGVLTVTIVDAYSKSDNENDQNILTIDVT